MEASIKVVVRVRPFTQEEESHLSHDASQSNSLYGLSSRKRSIRNIVGVLDSKMLVFDPIPQGANAAAIASDQRFFKKPVAGQRERKFVFDRVFNYDASQVQVYEESAKPLLDKVLDGFNGSVFAYGATGCGKTHTISGNTEQPGIIFLAIADLFERVKVLRTERNIEISVSYLEIYNERIRDLLGTTASAKQDLPLREVANQKMVVANLTTHNPESVGEVMDLIVQGNSRRTMSPTLANAVSSRSHAVLQVTVSQTERNSGTEEHGLVSTLSIIDLAGNERAATTKNQGQQMVEGANINKSLLALGKCITALCTKQRHIPYRDSKLTRLLKFSLAGNCSTAMIVCVSPSSAHYDETHNTLTYADHAKGIKTRATRNRVTADGYVLAYVKKIEEQKTDILRLQATIESMQASALCAGIPEKAREVFDSIKAASCDTADIRHRHALAIAKYNGAKTDLHRLAQLETIGIAQCWELAFNDIVSQLKEQVNSYDQSAFDDKLEMDAQKLISTYRQSSGYSEAGEEWLKSESALLISNKKVQMLELAAHVPYESCLDEFLSLILSGSPQAKVIPDETPVKELSRATSMPFLNDLDESPSKRARVASDSTLNSLHTNTQTPQNLSKGGKRVHWNNVLPPVGQFDSSMVDIITSPSHAPPRFSPEKENLHKS